jgi:hypothetical protein
MKKTILFLFVISLFSCKKDGFDEAPVPFEVLGSWQWVSISGGLAGITTKVDSTQQYILAILPDKKYIWCKNGDCSTGFWFYGERLSEDKKRTETTMSFSKTNSRNDFPMADSFQPFIMSSTIGFFDGNSDGVSYNFQKKK